MREISAGVPMKEPTAPAVTPTHTHTHTHTHSDSDQVANSVSSYSHDDSLYSITTFTVMGGGNIWFLFLLLSFDSSMASMMQHTYFS